MFPVCLHFATAKTHNNPRRARAALQVYTHRVFCTRKLWASNTTMLERVFEAQHLSQAHSLVQNDKRSAGNIMVIARRPEDRSNTFNNL
eukprot:3124426-Heterocapsa_arctica.AAC.1